MALNGNGGIGLGITLQVDDLASGVLDKTTEAVARLEKGLDRLEKGLDRLDRLDRQSKKTAISVASVGKAIFNAGRGFLEAAWKLASGAGGELEAATHEIEHFGKATSEQMLDVNEAIFSSQNALMGFTALDSAKALKALAIETGDAQKALDQLSPALLYAGITGKSGEAGVKAMTAAMRMFPQEGKDAGEVVDRLAVSSELFHVKASEMSDALGRAGPAARAVGASMTDTAITIGLMRTGMGNLGKTSMATMAALRGMANPKFGSTLKGIGIAAKDAAGNAKSLPTIMGELADKVGKTGTITDKTRDAMRKAFGPQALPGLTAAIKDLAKGVTDSNGVLHKGADAVQYYYDKMQNNEGAARALLDAQLNTFKGQEKVLNSVITSLKQGLSAPLASALKPAVRELALAGAKILEYFSKMDPETKTFIAQATLLAGVLVTVLGAAFIFLGGPAALAVGALIAVGAALFAAYHQNLGGFADIVDSTLGRAMLAFRVFASLFTHNGGLNKGLFKELSKDPSLMEFVINVWVTFNKVKEFVKGLVEGFQSGVAKIRPALDGLGTAVKNLAEKFGIMSGAVDPLANGNALKRAGANGRNFGEQLAKIAEVAVKLATKLIELAGWVVDLGKKLFSGIDPVYAIKGVFIAFAAVKFFQIATGLKAIGAALGASNPAILAATIAVAGLLIAYKELDDYRAKQRAIENGLIADEHKKELESRKAELARKGGFNPQGPTLAPGAGVMLPDDQMPFSMFSQNRGGLAMPNWLPMGGGTAAITGLPPAAVTPVPGAMPVPTVPGAADMPAVAGAEAGAADRGSLLAGMTDVMKNTKPAPVNVTTTIEAHVDEGVLFSAHKRFTTDQADRDGQH